MSRPDTINLYSCIGRQQFLHHLTAGAARHAGSWGRIALGIDAAHGQFNRLLSLADRREKGDPLCADAQSITGIFHIAAVDHTAVITPHCGPHVEVRVGAMGTAGGLASPHQ